MTHDLPNAADQATRFGFVLERDRQKRRVSALIVGFLLALAIFWTLKDAPAKIAATVLQAEAMPDSW